MPPRQRKIAIMGFRSVARNGSYNCFIEFSSLLPQEESESGIPSFTFRGHGKSSLTIQFVENQFVDAYDPTIENTFTKNVKIRGQEYQLELVDTAGQDEYSLVPQSYSMNIDGYVLVYSVTSAKSFEVVQVVHDKLLDLTGKLNLDVVKIIHEKILDMSGKQSLPLVLVGNKTDLRIERVVSTDEGKHLAEQWKGVFLEASAKENQKVSDIFKAIIEEIEKAEGNIPEKSGCVLQ